jgi:hypothetical protein
VPLAVLAAMTGTNEHAGIIEAPAIPSSQKINTTFGFESKPG